MTTKTSPPHLRAEGAVPRLAWLTALALFPAVLGQLVALGFDGFRVGVVSVGTVLLGEMGIRRIFGREPRLYDGSALVTGILFSLMLSPELASWQVALGALFAIVVGKEVFGGLGGNPFNPALAGVAFVLVSFGSSGNLETSFLQSGLVLASGILLLLTREVPWEIPFLYLGSALLFSLAPGFELQEIFLSRFLPLAAFFMVTDPVTTPLTRAGERWFALGAGALTALLRREMGEVAGVTYGILVMNSLTPWIDRWVRPKGVKQGRGGA